MILLFFKSHKNFGLCIFIPSSFHLRTKKDKCYFTQFHHVNLPFSLYEINIVLIKFMDILYYERPWHSFKTLEL